MRSPKFMTAVRIIAAITVAGLLATPALAAKRSKSRLSQEHNFKDKFVGGKYQYADEAIATVEDEKVLNNLLEDRKDFKDRLRKETKRR